jgi:hypothetical protein
MTSEPYPPSEARPDETITPRQALRGPVVGPRVPNNILFTLLIPITFLFCATILIQIMCTIGDARAPINRWMAAAGPTLLAIEAGGILVVGFAAMVIDRRRTLKAKNASPPTK